MKKIIIICSLMTIASGAFAQIPTAIEWEKNYGGTGGEYVISVVQTSDGGYIKYGSSNSSNGDVSNNHGNYDCWVAKVSAGGSLEWENSFGGSSDDWGMKVLELPNGSFILAGQSGSSDGDVSDAKGGLDYWLVKISSTGTLEWERSYGGSLDDQINDIALTSNGFIVVGVTYSSDGDVTGHVGNDGEVWVLRLAQNGSVLWKRLYGGTNSDFGSSIKPVSAGGYIFAGNTYSNDGDVSGNSGDSDLWIVRLDAYGTIQWQVVLGGSDYDEAKSIIELSDGKFAFAGGTRSNDGDVSGNHGNMDYWAGRITSTGTVLWNATYGGSNLDQAWGIVQATDGSLVVSGASRSFDGNVTGHHGTVVSNTYDYWLANINLSGTLITGKSYGGSKDDFCTGIIGSSDGGVVMFGYTESNDGNVGGNHSSNADIWIVKLEGTLSVKSLNDELPVTISPNPATNNITIEGADVARAEVYDAVGKLVLSAEHTNTLSLGSLSKGMYMIKLEAKEGEGYYSGRIIKE